MGNYISQRALENTSTKVILWDGRVEEYLEDSELTVAELMLEHPQQVVVELHAVLSTKRPTPLPADTKLGTNKVYIMLPVKRGKPAAMSPEQARHIMMTSNSSRALLLPSAKYVPLFARMCSVSVGDQMHEFAHGMQGERVEEEVHRPVKRLVLPETLLSESGNSWDGRADLLGRQISGKGNWKPSLDTIKERKDGKRLSPSLFTLKNLAVSFPNLK